MSHSAVDVVRDFITRFQKHDFDGVLSLITDDIVIHECDSLPYPGDHVGKEAFMRFADCHRKLWRFERVGDQDYRYLDAGPNCAIALASLPVEAIATGIKFDLKAAEIFTLRDGKIADVEVYYWDTKQVHDATNGIRLL